METLETVGDQIHDNITGGHNIEMADGSQMSEDATPVLEHCPRMPLLPTKNVFACFMIKCSLLYPSRNLG